MKWGEGSWARGMVIPGKKSGNGTQSIYLARTVRIWQPPISAAGEKVDLRGDNAVFVMQPPIWPKPHKK
jgi:hypothetical protein